MQHTRIGLIGCGEWGKLILRDLKTLNCHVTVVSISKKSDENAKIYNADVIINHIAKIKNVEGIIIATPASTHAAVIKSISHLDLPIFVEKPMTTNLQDAEQLVKDMGKRLFVMHKWRYHNGIKKLGELVRKKKLGNILSLHSVRFNWGNHHPDVDMIWTCLPHDLSITLEILGYIPKPRNALGTEWANETVGLNCILGQKPWNLIEISSIRPIMEREVRIECEEGFAILKDGYVNIIEIFYKKNWKFNQLEADEKIHFEFEMPLFSELREFIDYLRGGKLPKCNAEEGLAVVRTITELRNLAGLKHSGILSKKLDYYEIPLF